MSAVWDLWTNRTMPHCPPFCAASLDKLRGQVPLPRPSPRKEVLLLLFYCAFAGNCLPRLRVRGEKSRKNFPVWPHWADNGKQCWWITGQGITQAPAGHPKFDKRNSTNSTGIRLPGHIGVSSRPALVRGLAVYTTVSDSMRSWTRMSKRTQLNGRNHDNNLIHPPPPPHTHTNTPLPFSASPCRLNASSVRSVRWPTWATQIYYQT